MPESTISSKGQITIPAEVRRQLGLATGSRIRFVRTDTGSYEIVPILRSVTSLKGLIAAPAVPVSLAEMDLAIADSALGRDQR
jgi:AbrB family looped-hinge helix DNA binding protein